MGLFLSLVALISVLVILAAGLWTFLMGGNPVQTQKRMRWRVAAQGVALLVLLIVFFLAGD